MSSKWCRRLLEFTIDRATVTALRKLPRLSNENSDHSICKICGGTSPFYDVVDLNKCCDRSNPYFYGPAGICVKYFRCSTCEFLFTNFFDSWTKSDFSEFIYNDDYVKIDGEYDGIRSAREARSLAVRLKNFPNLRILDYGSGSGILEKSLKNAGFLDVTSFDPFSNPTRPVGLFDVVTCFEVLEHAVSPIDTMNDIESFRAKDGCILMTTGIQPDNIAEVRSNWWYVGPRNGHISIHSVKSLSLLAKSALLFAHISANILAFSPRYASDATQKITHLIGHKTIFFQLTAPGIFDADVGRNMEDAWHGLEGPVHSRYRWTGAEQITWQFRDQPISNSNVILTIPVINEIEPGFAEACHLLIAGQLVPLRRQMGVLTASFYIEQETDPTFTLVTPRHKRPSDIGSVADNRALGLAISADFFSSSSKHSGVNVSRTS